MGSSSGGNPGMASQGGVPIAGQSPRFGGNAGAMRQQLAGLLGGGGGMPGNPAPPQIASPGPTLARPAMGAATPAQLAMPTGAPGHGGGWMGYSGTGTGDWNYATQGHGGTGPYNYAGFNVSHGVGDDPAKGQVSSLSLPGTAGMLARPAGPQMGFLPRPGG
jgi:hypothetical protein